MDIPWDLLSYMCCDGSVIWYDLLTPPRLSNPHGGCDRNTKDTRKHLIMVTKDDVAGQGAGHVERGLDHDDIMTWKRYPYYWSFVLPGGFPLQRASDTEP